MADKVKLVGEATIETKVLYERLKELPIGGQVSYAELSDAIGRDVQDGGRGSMESARRMLINERVLFGVDRGKGLVRLDDRQIADTYPVAVKKVQRVAKRQHKRGACIANFAALPQEQKTAVYAAQSFLGAVELMSKPSEMKRVEERTAKAQAALPMAKLLEAFK